MKKNLKLFSIFLCILIYTLKGQSKVSPTYLFYLEATKYGCTWFMALPPKLTPIKVNQTKSCNKHILFSKLKPDMLYYDNKAIHKLTLKGKVNRKKVANLPFKISESDQLIMSAKNKIWVVRDVFLSNKPVIIKDGKEFITYKNKKYPKKDYEYSSVSELYELNNNKWTRLDMQVNPGSDDSFGMVTAVLEGKEISKNYNSFSKKIDLGRCCTSTANNLDKNSIAFILKLVGGSEDSETEEYDYKPVNANQAIVSKVDFGDTPHYVSPVYMCENKCKLNKKLKIYDFSPMQMGIHVNSAGYFLIGEEYSHAKVQVFNLKSINPIKVFPKAVFATWLRQDYFE